MCEHNDLLCERLEKLHDGKCYEVVKRFQWRSEEDREPWCQIRVIRDIDEAVTGEGKCLCEAVADIERQLQKGGKCQT